MLRSAVCRLPLQRRTGRSIGGVPGSPWSRSSQSVAAGAGVAASVVALSGYSYLYHSEEGRGLRRQARFWSQVAPVVCDYYWRSSASSPYVRWYSNNDRDEDVEWDVILSALHEKHAPTLFRTMLELKGLYVKLGQVLSVTALPVPEAYRLRFRTLQSDVPGHEEFEDVVRPVVERDLHVDRLEDVFAAFNPEPCGAASIGQAHRAILKKGNVDVVVKVQYPDAAWQVPADIKCVGDLLKLCVFFGVVDEAASRLSYEEFARQFSSELDYDNERRNLEEVHRSSLDPTAPYFKHGVVLPQVYPEACGDKVVTMSYLPGPKFEAECKRQLAVLGINADTMQSVVLRDAAREASNPTVISQEEEDDTTLRRRATRKTLAMVHPIPTGSTSTSTSSSSSSYSSQVAQFFLRRIMGVDSTLWAMRQLRRLVLWYTSLAVFSVQAVPTSIVTDRWQEWAESHATSTRQAQRLRLTEGWVHALFDVHGHQIFNLGLFNADPHPGNLLLIEEEEGTSLTSDHSNAQLGLIDFGQCKRLTPQEQVDIAHLVLSVADKHDDETVADRFRTLGIKTQNDSTPFLAAFARLMFGAFKPEHLDPEWHRGLHESDKILYFPKELSMVYRTSLLLRGLGMSLQINCAIGEEWREHAREAIARGVVDGEKRKEEGV